MHSAADGILKEEYPNEELQPIVDKFEKELEAEFPQLKVLDLFIKSNGSLYIGNIYITPEFRRQGIGSQIINRIKQFADKHNLIITLSPEPDRGFKAKLDKFYKSHGFIPNKGRHKDYRLSNMFGRSMFRKPGVNETTSQKIPIFRGVSVYNKKYDNYYTTNKEWARQFTQSGRDSEIKQAFIDTNVIYKANPLPNATSDEEISNTISIAKVNGFKAIWIDEGTNEPNSIYIIDKTALLK
jgi:GNAT superfamily N-acetyltransferase